MQHHEFFSEKLLITLTPVLLAMNVGHFLSGLSSFVIITYYLSKLKKEVVNVDYEGSWVKYIKSMLKK